MNETAMTPVFEVIPGARLRLILAIAVTASVEALRLPSTMSGRWWRRERRARRQTGRLGAPQARIIWAVVDQTSTLARWPR